MKLRQYPEWLKIAKNEIGVKEFEGPADNPVIIKYHDVTSLQATDDEVHWCSSFACWCMESAGIRSPRSARAKDWLDWGIPLNEGKLGCIVVFTRNGGGHVGFYIDEDEDGIFVLGGNQNDSVNISYYGWENFLDFRWPETP